MKVTSRNPWAMSGALVALLCTAAAAQQAFPNPPISLDNLLKSIQTAQAAARPQVSYQLIREYRLFGARNTKADSEVVVEVNFTPPSSEAYTIQKYSGSSRGQQLVRNVLNHEIEVTSKNSKASSAINKENYDFTYLGEQMLDGKPCYVLGLKPKRNERDLISGELWVDAHSFLVRQIEGEVEKTPSWWVKKIQLKLVFANLEGIWVQTNMEAVADVRIFGSHTLTSHIVDYRKEDEVAVSPLGTN